MGCRAERPLSALWLGERVDRVRWIVAGVGFCGVLIVMRRSVARQGIGRAIGQRT